MLYSIKSFCTVQQAAVHHASIPNVLVNRLVNNPAAQRCTTHLLEPKLKIIPFEQMTIVEEDNPIKQFEDCQHFSRLHSKSELDLDKVEHIPSSQQFSFDV